MTGRVHVHGHTKRKSNTHHHPRTAPHPAHLTAHALPATPPQPHALPSLGHIHSRQRNRSMHIQVHSGQRSLASALTAPNTAQRSAQGPPCRERATGERHRGGKWERERGATQRAHQTVEFDISCLGARHSAQKLQSITLIITRALFRSHTSTGAPTAPLRHHNGPPHRTIRARTHRNTARQSVATARDAPQRPPRSHALRHDGSDSVSMFVLRGSSSRRPPLRPARTALGLVERPVTEMESMSPRGSW